MGAPMTVGGGTNAVVTGAAGGIGEAIAQRLLEAGASVVLGDLDGSRASRRRRAGSTLTTRAASPMSPAMRPMRHTSRR